MDNFVELISDEFKNIYFIKGARNGKYPYSHSLLIEDYLIDTGISSRLLRKLKRQFPIKNVLLSHWHEDHTSGNRLLSNANFFIHSKDKFLIENVDKFYEYYGISNSPAEEEFEWLWESFKLDNTKIENTLTDNEIIKVGNDYELKVIHTPGHTAGHCSFLELNSKIAFLADIDLTNFVFYAGIDSNLIDFEESLDKLIDLDIKMVATGHRGIIEGGKEIKEELTKYKSVIHKRDERILSNLSETKPILVIDFKGKNLIYKYYSEFKDYEIIAEMIMIQKHFDKFIKNKLIERESKGYSLS
ncbi:MAG: MBL fold metallo-hydrolase [Candidatus Lokiarchaeota archaeon]|nr:MBL fold metallo-hydrolase [Candidatus Lokiarchaeota archaeon]